MTTFNICREYIDKNESNSKVKDCTCIGIWKQRFEFAGPPPPIQWVGIIKNYKTTCYGFVPHEFPGYVGYDKEIPCK